MMKKLMHIVFFVLIIPFAGCSQLKNSGVEPPYDQNRRLAQYVKEKLSHIEYKRNSKLSYMAQLLPKGVTINPKPEISSEPGITLNEDGYLAFIDEAPAHDWSHPAKIVFIPVAPNNTPQILFKNKPPSWFNIVGGHGEEIMWTSTKL